MKTQFVSARPRPCQRRRHAAQFALLGQRAMAIHQRPALNPQPQLWTTKGYLEQGRGVVGRTHATTRGIAEGVKWQHVPSALLALGQLMAVPKCITSHCGKHGLHEEFVRRTGRHTAGCWGALPGVIAGGGRKRRRVAGAPAIPTGRHKARFFSGAHGRRVWPPTPARCGRPLPSLHGHSREGGCHDKHMQWQAQKAPDTEEEDQAREHAGAVPSHPEACAVHRRRRRPPGRQPAARVRGSSVSSVYHYSLRVRRVPSRSAASCAALVF